jgi:hypothetical protein
VILSLEIIFSLFLAVIIADSFNKFPKSAHEKPTVFEASDLKSISLLTFLFLACI